MTTSAPAARGTLATLLARLDPADRRSLLGMGAVILGLHVVGLGVLFGLVVPAQHQLGGSTPVFGAGVGVLAYTFGLRHAFDADHIAAVDNTTRKLLTDRALAGTTRRPLSVGFWFSLGHSSIVFGLAFALAAGVKALAGQVDRRRVPPARGHRYRRRLGLRASSSGSSASRTSSSSSVSSGCSGGCATASTTSRSWRSSCSGAAS